MKLRLFVLACLFTALLAGADQEYWFGFLRTNPSAAATTPEQTKTLMSQHMDNINAMALSGDLAAAGPTPGGPSIRGIFLFRPGAKAKELGSADPLVKAGLLTFDAYKWKAPAGLGDRFFAEFKSNPKMATKMVSYQLVMVSKGAPDGLLTRFANSDKLVVEGPVQDGGDLKALVVLQAETRQAAQALIEADPDVRAGKLTIEVSNWMVAEGVLRDK